MKNIKNYLSKILLIVLMILISVGTVGCKKKEKPDNRTECEKNGHTWVDATYEEPKHCSVCGVTEGDPLPKPKPNPGDVTISIEGNSTIKSGQTLKLTSSVLGTSETAVTWEITSGSEYAEIDQKGNLTAKETFRDEEVVIKITCKANEEISATKTIRIISKPTLTQDMLDYLNDDYLGVDGFIKIDLYTIGLFEKFEQSSNISVKTAMDGVHWYAEYEDGTTGGTRSTYYKNHNNVACEVGVSLMNEEEYFPLTDDNDVEVSWEKSGLYNSLKGIKASDFTLNEDTWYYDYTGNDKELTAKVLAACNPYDFILKSNPTFSLIIESGEVMGITMTSDWDYSIVNSYKAVQELNVFFTAGEENVKVPTIGKFNHEPIHDQLSVAIENMRNLNNYTLRYTSYTYSVISGGLVGEGFYELVTQNDCYFTPFNVKNPLKTDEEIELVQNDNYGFHKFNDNLYNSYTTDKDGSFVASRAFESDFANAKPSFMFAAEIFTAYAEGSDGSITYYVNDAMSTVATTFYYGVGNDINLYGIYATRGYTSTTTSFTPYVTVKDGYIVDAGFYFNMGYLYGVIELEYSEVNNTTMPEDVNVDFAVRNNPTSWSELVLNVSEDDSTLDDDQEVNALEYFKAKFEDENIGDRMPFFNECLGDTFGFGLSGVHISSSDHRAYMSMTLYYDVPLDINYSIESSLKKVENYLISLGFTKNQYDEFTKDDIVVAPVDQGLDLLIYVWRSKG